MNWELDLSQAESYEEYLVPAIFVPLSEALIAIASPRQGERVLDVGCGTGVVSRAADQMLGTGGRVVALDIDPGMLRVARSAEPPEAGRIMWTRADAVRLPFETAAFDLALCQAVLQFIPERVNALQEIHRVLATTGRLVVSVFSSIERNPTFEVLAEALERHVSAEIAQMRRAIFSLGQADELLSLLGEAGFRETRLSTVHKWVSFPSPEEFLRRQLASQSPWVIIELDSDRRAALMEEMNSNLKEFVDDHGLRFPMEAHVVVASK